MGSLGIVRTVVPRRATEYTMKDPMELGIAAKARLKRRIEHRTSLAIPINVKKTFDALTVAEVDQRESCLLVEEATEASRAQSRIPCQFRKRPRGRAVPDQSRNAFYRGMYILYGDIARTLEAFPGEKQSVRNSRIQQRLMSCSRKVRVDFPESLHVLLCEAPASIALNVRLKQGTSWDINGSTANHPTAKNADPHPKIRCLFYENVFLGGKEPEEIATADLVAAISEEVDTTAASYKVELKFGVSMATVCRGKVVVLPNATVQLRLQVKVLTHDKKR